MALRNDLLQSTSDINRYISSHKQAYAAYYSDLLEAFAFLSPMRFYLVTALFLSNVSNFTRTQNLLSLVVNVPSILMLLIYPMLREKKILGPGHASGFGSLIMLVVSLQWSFSFHILTVSSPEHLTPTLVTMIVAVIWIFSLGSRRLVNFTKALLASAIFIGLMTYINSEFVRKNLGGFSTGLCIGYCFNYAIDLMLRFRFYVIAQQEELLTKTAKIESIFEASPVAFFTIGHGMTLNENAAPALQTILGMKVEKGYTFSSLLSHSSLSAEEQTMTIQILQACIQEDVLTFQLNDAHLPQHFTLTTSMQESRSIKASYTPLLGKDQRVYEILVTFADITQIEIEAASRKLAEAEGETLLRFVRIPPHLANLFIQTCQETLSSLRALQNSGHVPEDLPRRLHTLKGNARSLELAALAQCVHEIEDQLKKSGPLTHNIRFSDSLVALLQRLQEFHREVWERKETRLSLRDFIGQTIEQAAHEVCVQLHKKEPRLQIDVDEACDAPWLRRILFEILPLLVTNAMDHGIENREERLARGKAEQGLLTLNLQARLGGIHILFQDDGQGLNLEAIRRKLSSVSGTNAVDVAAVIFQPGFSTRDIVSTLSGRGVGLDAVSTRIREAQGTLEIVSYQPFCLLMVLPRHPN